MWKWVAAALGSLVLATPAVGASISLDGAQDISPPGTAQVTVTATSDAPGIDFDELVVWVQLGDTCTGGGTTGNLVYLPISAGNTFTDTRKFTPPYAGQLVVCGVVRDFDTGAIYAQTSTTFTSIGPIPWDIYNCSSFPLPDGTTPQQYLDRWPTDPSRLDGDKDGLACEDFSYAPPAPVVPTVPTTPVVPTTPAVVEAPIVINTQLCRVLKASRVSLTKKITQAQKARKKALTVAGKKRHTARIKSLVRQRAGVVRQITVEDC